MIVVLCLMNALSVAFSNLLGGIATRKLPLAAVLLLAGPSALLVALALTLADPRPATTGALAMGMAAGFIGGAGIPLAYRALATGPVGVAATVIACTSTATVSVFAVLQTTEVSGSRLGGLVCCVLAVVLVSSRGGGLSTAPRRGVLLALAAGVAFGVFVIMMSATPSGAGWWPLVAARMGVIVVAIVFFFAVITRQGFSAVALVRDFYPAWLAAVGAGVADVAGNAFLVLALRGGDLLLVAILSSIAPAVTALLGWLILRERLTIGQRIGVGAAVVAVVLTST